MSAPSLPGLLQLEDQGLLSSLAAGTEVEVQFGRSLQVCASPYFMQLKHASLQARL